MKGSKQINLDIVAFQEHNWKTNNDIDIVQNRKFYFFYVSALKEGHGGVANLIKNHLTNCIIKVTKINS